MTVDKNLWSAFLLDFIISAYPHKILKSTLFGLKKTKFLIRITPEGFSSMTAYKPNQSFLALAVCDVQGIVVSCSPLRNEVLGRGIK